MKFTLPGREADVHPSTYCRNKKNNPMMAEVHINKFNISSVGVHQCITFETNFTRIDISKLLISKTKLNFKRIGFK